MSHPMEDHVAEYRDRVAKEIQEIKDLIASKGGNPEDIYEFFQAGFDKKQIVLLYSKFELKKNV